MLNPGFYFLSSTQPGLKAVELSKGTQQASAHQLRTHLLHPLRSSHIHQSKKTKSEFSTDTPSTAIIYCKNIDHLLIDFFASQSPVDANVEPGVEPDGMTGALQAFNGRLAWIPQRTTH